MKKYVNFLLILCGFSSFSAFAVQTSLGMTGNISTVCSFGAPIAGTLAPRMATMAAQAGLRTTLKTAARYTEESLSTLMVTMVTTWIAEGCTSWSWRG